MKFIYLNVHVNEIVEPTTLHLPVAYIDDITRPIAICNDTHKFAAYLYSTLQEFAVDNKVIVTSRCEAVRKLHAWRKDFDRALKRIASIAYELDTWIAHGILVLALSSAGMMCLGLLSMP